MESGVLGSIGFLAGALGACGGRLVMRRFLREQRRELDAWLTSRGLGHTFSLTTYGVARAATRLIEARAHGVCLDAGAGRAPYTDALRARAAKVLSIDIEDRGGDVTYIADIQDMPVVESATIDTVICTEVLEHVPRPWAAVAEIARVLKPGGYLILTVPHLSPIHEAPHDYYRYTRYGLASLLEAGGLEVVEIGDVGGIVALLGHGASMVFFLTAGALRPLRRLAWLVNYVVLVRLLDLVDRAIGMADLYPSNVVALARKGRAG